MGLRCFDHWLMRLWLVSTSPCIGVNLALETSTGLRCEHSSFRFSVHAGRVVTLEPCTHLHYAGERV